MTTLRSSCGPPAAVFTRSAPGAPSGSAAADAVRRARRGRDSAASGARRWPRSAAARVAILGIPSDCGAGLVRGAAFGPQAVRAALLAPGARFPERAARRGDRRRGRRVRRAAPPARRHAERRAAPPHARWRSTARRRPKSIWPVAPLSIAERVVDRLLRAQPRAAHLHARRRSLRGLAGGGGDRACTRRRAAGRSFTPTRTPICCPSGWACGICFATWAYHANELLGRGGRLVQVGVRRRPDRRSTGSATLGVRQFWADEVRARGARVIDEVIAHLRALGVQTRLPVERHRRDRRRGGPVDRRARAGRPDARLRARAHRARRRRRFRCWAPTWSRSRRRSAAPTTRGGRATSPPGICCDSLAVLADAPDLMP